MEITPTTQIRFSDYQCHTILECAKIFFAKKENQDGFNKWLKEQEETKKIKNGKDL